MYIIHICEHENNRCSGIDGWQMHVGKRIASHYMSICSIPFFYCIDNLKKPLIK